MLDRKYRWKRPWTGARRREPIVNGVWIVQHDESPHNTVLGVFAAEEVATAYMEKIKDNFRNGVLLSYFPIGYRHTGWESRYGAPD